MRPAITFLNIQLSNSRVTTIKKGTTVTYTNKKLKSKKTYQYKVRAYRQNGNTTAYGSYSDILKVRTK